MHSCPDAQVSTDKLAVLWDEKGHTFVCALMLSGVKSIDNGPLKKLLWRISYIYYSEIPVTAYLWLAGILALSTVWQRFTDEQGHRQSSLSAICHAVILLSIAIPSSHKDQQSFPKHD